MANPNNVTYFDTNSEPQEEVIPTLPALIKNAIAAYSSELRVCMPATVLAYDFKAQSVDVQPVFQRVYNTGKAADMGKIYKVPVVFPRGSKSYMSFPIVPGDFVLLVFADRSLDNWLSTGAKGPPPDSKQHHLSDAFAIPGGYPYSKPAPVSNPTDIILHNGPVEIRIKDNNHLQVFNGLGSPSGNDLIQILSQMLEIIRAAQVATCGGPQQLHHPLFAEIQAKLDSFKEG